MLPACGECPFTEAKLQGNGLRNINKPLGLWAGDGNAIAGAAE